ncbi:MAG: hypothetical protein R3321_07815, partial [Nitrososphaeraceae archaeon]|nr:hypothetical protein [Nitrososphaeraceae archaeon]
ADLDDVFIVRDGKELEVDVQSIMVEGGSLRDIGIKSGDQIYVPRSFWADPARFTWIISAIAVIITAVALFVR